HRAQPARADPGPGQRPPRPADRPAPLRQDARHRERVAGGAGPRSGGRMMSRPERQTVDAARTAPGASRRPRLLFLCQTLPFPPDSGVHIRSYNILKLLAGAFDVTALYFVRRATRPTERHVQQGLAALREFGEAYAFPIESEHSRARLVRDHLGSVASRRPY